MIALVGNAPSSGSTLLADLLDSTPITACGPELGLFSSEHFYSAENISRILFRSSRIPDVYVRRTGLFKTALPHYGLTTRSIKQISQRRGPTKFATTFAKNYLAYRERDVSGLVFEKSPVNCGVIGLFLNTFKSNYFIFMVRNPLSVLESLHRRGFDRNIALMTWLLSAASFYPFKNHPRAMCIKYEDLIQAPYLTAQQIIKKATGQSIPTELIKTLYKTNSYRSASVQRVPTWRSKNSNKIEILQPDRINSTSLKFISTFLEAKVNKKYADLFYLPDITFRQALDEFGYTNSLLNILPNNSTKQNPLEFPSNTKFTLLKKWARDLLVGDSRGCDRYAYMQPVVY